jgi:ATP-dependent Lon protease
MDLSTDTPVTITAPVFPLKNSVPFPNMMLPVTAGRPASIAAVEAALATEDKQIAVFTQRDASIEEPSADDLYSIGTLCVIKRMQRYGKVIQLMIQGNRRIERIAAIHSSPYPKVQFRILPELVDTSAEVEALHRTMLDLAAQMLSLSPSQIQFDLDQMISVLERPIQQAYILSTLTSIDVEKQNQLLAANSQLEGLQLIVEFLTHEIQVLEVQDQISKSIESRMSKEQHEMMLRQQLHEIQGLLGDTSPEQAEVAELRRRMEEASLPELVHKEIEKELSRLERMSANAADYQTSRSYVDLVLDMPWQKTTEDNLDLARAREILDEDHFDLKEVKDRIIEHLAVMKLNPSAKAPILCFVGPPGVGKTSLGQSIARALGRVFERMSLGGLHDEAELRGHRRTYVGAMPGRIIRAIRRVGVKNPLLMLDEIDKLGRDFRGDPAAALMEILDPSQNVEFQDNYLDLPFDLSRVFFITTANTLDTIPGPLLDRIEVLRLSGYSDMEKREIARRYILDRRMQEAGLKDGQLIVGDKEMNYIIEHYTREAGVRSLERALGKITRKLAMRFAEGNTEPVLLTVQMIAELLGPARMSRELRRTLLPSGVVAGLAWTEAGGEVLYVEALLLPEGKELILTGQLGSVMQDSARAAHTAMTGEITLSGLVLPIGGLKEKILAAHRAGFKQVILPKENEADLVEIPQQVTQEMNFVLVENINEVFAAAMPELSADK